MSTWACRNVGGCARGTLRSRGVSTWACRNVGGCARGTLRSRGVSTWACINVGGCARGTLRSRGVSTSSAVFTRRRRHSMSALTHRPSPCRRRHRCCRHDLTGEGQPNGSAELWGPKLPCRGGWDTVVRCSAVQCRAWVMVCAACRGRGERGGRGYLQGSKPCAYDYITFISSLRAHTCTGTRPPPWQLSAAYGTSGRLVVNRWAG